MEIPPHFILHQTEHWVVNHRLNSALPGYLMLSAKMMTHSLSALPSEALNELGVLQARIQQTIEDQLAPKRLYIGRFGHDTHCSIHFHFIPVYPWVEALFWKDERYRVLQRLGSIPNAQALTDGAELTLFVWREFCERPDPPTIEGPSVANVIIDLRDAFATWPN